MKTRPVDDATHPAPRSGATTAHAPLAGGTAAFALVVCCLAATALNMIGPHPAGWLWIWVACIVLLTSLASWFALHRLMRIIVGLDKLMGLAAPRPDRRAGLIPDPIGELQLSLLAFQVRLVDTVKARRSARERAEEADRYETEFLRSLSHELRTPLNAIVGFSEVLLAGIDGPLSDGQREDLETILSSGQQLGELVDDVLDLAAMQSGRVSLERVPMDVRPLLEDVAQLLLGQRRGREVDVQCVLPDKPVLVLGDQKRLRQVVINLASNAMKFTESGFVRLSAEGDATTVRLSVEDSGPGIGPEDLNRIFEEFAQVGDVRRKGQGSGLGLTICKRLTEMHEGRISVDSVVGQGSHFRVHLERYHP